MIGGNMVPKVMYKFVVEITDILGNHKCTGSIISAKHILSIQSCIDEGGEFFILIPYNPEPLTNKRSVIFTALKSTPLIQTEDPDTGLVIVEVFSS